MHDRYEKSVKIIISLRDKWICKYERALDDIRTTFSTQTPCNMLS